MRWHKMHSFTLSLSHCLSFSLFFLRLPQELGVSCNLSVGFSLSCRNTCSIISISLSSGKIIPISSLGHSPGSPIFLLLLSSHGSRLGFLPILSACLQHVCDRAALQEGRQADDHWDLQWLRSGANSAHGEHVFPCLCGMPENTNSAS